MSNTSSMFSFAEDTFMNTKSRSKGKKIGNGFSVLDSQLNDTTNNASSFNASSFNESMSTTNRLHNLPIHEISPYKPLNPLIESPFQPSKFESSFIEDPRLTNSNDATMGNDLLKKKIRAHQRRFHDNMKTTNPIEIDNKTYLQSAFNSRRNYLTEPTREFKPVNTNKTQSKGKSEHTTLSKDINNPYFVEALGRIVNKEIELRKLLFGILVFGVYRFLRSIIRLFVYTSPIVVQTCNNVSSFLSKQASFSEGFSSLIISKIATLFTFESLLTTGSYFEIFLTSLLIFVIVSSAYRLVKPQDKCLDLPLTKAQRKILGLSLDDDLTTAGVTGVVDDDEDEDTESIMKRLASASPQRMEQPVKIVVPDNDLIDGVMGSLNGLALRGQYQRHQGFNTGNNVGNQTWNSQPTNITPSGKYMFEKSDELRGNGNTSFY